MIAETATATGTEIVGMTATGAIQADMEGVVGGGGAEGATSIVAGTRTGQQETKEGHGAR